MIDCTYSLRCMNNDKCYRCFNEKLLKLKEDKFKKKHSKVATKKVALDTDDTWKDLEQQVANKLNAVPTMQEARRTRRSGAMEFELGDIKDTILHPECKERRGRDLKTGTKSITLQKDWLEKAKEECKYTSKTMCLPFRFKGDDTIYNIMEFDDLAALVTTIKAYQQDNAAKEKEIELLKSMVKSVN